MIRRPRKHSSVFAWHGYRRYNRCLEVGIAKVDAGLRFRVGSEEAKMSLNAFISHFELQDLDPKYRNTALTWVEERKVVRMLLEKEHNDAIIPFKAIMDTTSQFVKTLSAERVAQIPFKNLKPSKTFCVFFQKRHCYAIYCERPIIKDGVQTPFLSATEMVTYLKDLSNMIKCDKLDPKNICSITARTVQVEVGEGKEFFKSFTMFTVSNAIGELLSFTHLVHNEDLATAASESIEFQNWLSQMSEQVRAAGVGSEEAIYPYHLLLCDESYSFMNNVLRDWLFKREIIVYSIPGLSDGFPGNHDVGCANALEEKFMGYVSMDVQNHAPPKAIWSESTLISNVTMARYVVLTPRNIAESFADAGIYPLDEVRFFKHPRPLSFQCRNKVCDMETMCKMLDQAMNNIHS